MTTGRTVAIIQSRMGSTRLPGKVMSDIAGKPMLLRVVERVRQARLVDEVVVATTGAQADDAIAGFCTAHGISCYRGSEADVLDRYYQAALAWGADVIVRITADCPLIDPGIIDEFIRTYQRGEVDYVAAGTPRTFPDGLDTEVFSLAALQRSWREASWTSEREHVTPYIWKNPGLFPQLAVRNAEDLSALRWTVDQEEDLECVRAIYARLGEEPFGWRDVLALVRRDPELAGFNAGIQCNEGYGKSVAEDRIVRRASGGAQ